MPRKEEGNMLKNSFFATGKKGPSVLDVLSEVAFDADYFNETAFDTYPKDLETRREVTAVLIDGATTRLDRPEILKDILTYWNKTQEECDQATETIPYHEQYQHMLSVQMDILRGYLLKIKKAAPQAAIALCIPTDDTHYSVSALVDELTRYKKSEGDESAKNTGEQIREKRQIIREAETEIKKIESERRNITRMENKLNKIIEQAKEKISKLTAKTKPRAKTAKEIKALENSIAEAKAKLAEFSAPRNEMRRSKESADKRIERAKKSKSELEEKLQEEKMALSLFRHKKSRPEHQQRTHEFTKIFLESYTKLCKDLGIRLITKPGVLKLGDLTVDYAHSRHRTWTVIKSRDKQLVMSKHGRLTRRNMHKVADFIAAANGNVKVEELTLEEALAQSEVKKSIVDEAKLHRIDVILETGHHGIGFKQTQKIADIPEEINFENMASYCPVIAEEHVMFLMAPPFEDQEKIMGFKLGRKPARMKLGIPLNTTAAEVFKRLDNGSVSGLCTIYKFGHDLIQTEWIQYQNFKDGSVLEKPRFYSLTWLTSDEHKGSPHENLAAQKGVLQLMKESANEPSEFRGRPAKAIGYINAGDTCEANSSSWPDRPQHKPDPEKALNDIMNRVVNLDKRDLNNVVEFSMQMMSYVLSGSSENMADNLDHTANYLMKYIEMLMPLSPLKVFFAHVGGNHTDDMFRKIGTINEAYALKQRLTGAKIKYYETGVDKRLRFENIKEEARIYFGGGGTKARILNIPDFGTGLDGKPVFVKPCNLLVQHDPKGELTDAGRGANADLTITGHKHSNAMKLYPTGYNTFSVLYQAASLQAVTDIEKYYAGGIPRTQAAHYWIMPMPGHFVEMTIPAYILNKIGMKVLLDESQKASTPQRK